MKKIFLFVCFSFLSQDSSVALEPVLGLAHIDQAELKITEILLPLPPKRCDYRCMPRPPPPGKKTIFYAGYLALAFYHLR